MKDNQKTLKKSYVFEGKGLHSGLDVRMTLLPAPENTGILFRREDIGENAFIPANVDYVTHTERGTTLEKDGARVSTIEHILATFVGLGVDNAIISLNNIEAPIMDGSANDFAKAISADGLQEQNAPREYFTPKEPIHFEDPKTGSRLSVYPADEFSIDLTIDFNSKVLGIQNAHYDSGVDYATEIAPCRTFVFFHELEYLFNHNLIRGGDAENAIVIIEHEVPQDTLDRMVKLFNAERIERLPEGYLNNLTLRFPNECARHKLLDVMGDFALSGMKLKARVEAYKPGHLLNTKLAKLIREAAINK